MNPFKVIKQWWSGKRSDYYKSRAAKRAYQLECLSCELINVMEYDGKIYVSHNGVPIVRVERINIDVAKLMAESRKDYLAWKSKFEK